MENQRTEEWYNIRATRSIASDIVDICAAFKDGTRGHMITLNRAKFLSRHFREEPTREPKETKGVDTDRAVCAFNSLLS
jgi:hypothetical protein